MTDLQFDEDKSLMPRMRQFVEQKKDSGPILRFLQKIGIAKDESSANVVAIALAIIFFGLSIFVFMYLV